MSLSQIAWQKRGEARSALRELGLTEEVATKVSNRLPYKIAERLTAELAVLREQREKQ